mmetsp:Transcript_50815/g.108503  ORF Transcript_50815/g.108503 Transcript_50815/m.108503 type:complete len:82 (-) Transcript_50815:216-461(-)
MRAHHKNTADNISKLIDFAWMGAWMGISEGTNSARTTSRVVGNTLADQLDEILRLLAGAQPIISVGVPRQQYARCPVRIPD